MGHKREGKSWPRDVKGTYNTKERVGHTYHSRKRGKSLISSKITTLNFSSHFYSKYLFKIFSTCILLNLTRQIFRATTVLSCHTATERTVSMPTLWPILFTERNADLSL